MVKNLFKKSLQILLKRQTNILSAAFVIMGTVVFSQLLGWGRQRLLISIFGVSNDLYGIYTVAGKLPDTLFQLIIAAGLSSAFIPVFSNYITKGDEKAGHQMAATLLTLGLIAFGIFSLVLGIFAPFFLQFFNVGDGYTATQMILMSNLMRIIIFSQFLFIIAIFLTALLQSYNHFFIPGFAAALYNLGIIVGILLFSKQLGIYSAAIGCVIGAVVFLIAQLPLAHKVGFRFRLSFKFRDKGVQQFTKLMWPRTLAIGIFQTGSLITLALISFLNNPGRSTALLDLAQTLAYAPVGLVGQAISQASLPFLSRERDNKEEFKQTFITSFNQMLYLVLPISILMLVLRIPIVRLVYGAPKLTWMETVLAGRTLAFLTLSIFSQALIMLLYRGFYALHNTKVPLLTSLISTAVTISAAWILIVIYHFDIRSVAAAVTLGSFVQLGILLFILDKVVGGFDRKDEFITLVKFFFCTLFMGFALYIPIKLLDQLVFDTTRTINLLILTSISSIIGISLYLFLTWFFNIKEAQTYVMLVKRLGHWREALSETKEVIDANQDRNIV